MKKAKIFALVIILSALSTTQANILCGEPNGTADLFDWQDGQSLYGLFGDPTPIGGNTLAFFPSGFRAESIDDSADSVYDLLEFELTAHSGFSFQNITITEYGDYGVFDTGGVQVFGSLTVTNLDTMESLTAITNSDLSTPETDATLPWQAWTQLDIGASDWTHIKIAFENHLYAASDDGSIAFIEKKVVGNAITLQTIPEPATITILSIGAVVMFGNLRNKKTVI